MDKGLAREERCGAYGHWLSKIDEAKPLKDLWIKTLKK